MERGSSFSSWQKMIFEPDLMLKGTNMECNVFWTANLTIRPWYCGNLILCVRARVWRKDMEDMNVSKRCPQVNAYTYINVSSCGFHVCMCVCVCVCVRTNVIYDKQSFRDVVLRVCGGWEGAMKGYKQRDYVCLWKKFIELWHNDTFDFQVHFHLWPQLTFSKDNLSIYHPGPHFPMCLCPSD